MPPAIEIENLSKRFRIAHMGNGRNADNTLRDRLVSAWQRARSPKTGKDTVEDFWALRDVSFSIEQGSIVGLIGPNGAGKSTLLKLLSRIMKPTSGRITYRGKVASLLEVGSGFHPELTGRENIYLNGAILGMPRDYINRKFDEIVAFSEIESFLDTPVKRYSSGMHMRLAFAVAAYLESDILLVDEVLAVGDAAFQKKCLGKMEEVGSSGRTVVFVSHNMQSVAALCGRAVLLNGGLLTHDGSASETITAYLSSFSALRKDHHWQHSEAPGGNGVKLLEMEVSSEAGDLQSFPSDAALTIRLKIFLERIPASLCVGFDLVSEEGVVIFRSYNTDSSPDQWPELRIGHNTLDCEVPPAILNGGEYYVAPRIGLHNKQWIVYGDPALRFTLHLNHGLSPFWNSLTPSARPGAVAPILRWWAAK